MWLCGSSLSLLRLYTIFARAPHDKLTFDNLFGVLFRMLETSIEWVSQINLAGLNADAVFTSLPITVGGNVHIIFGKQMFTNKWDRKLFRSA